MLLPGKVFTDVGSEKGLWLFYTMYTGIGGKLLFICALVVNLKSTYTNVVDALTASSRIIKYNKAM